MGKENHRRLMVLLTQAGVDEDTRHELVYGWTGGRTSSTKGLYENELNDMIWKLQHDSFFTSNLNRSANAMKELAIKQKRSNVLAIAQRCGLHGGTDFKQFNGFMENRSILKKRLNKYTLEELDQLIQQMHAIEANYKASSNHVGTKAWHEHYGIPQSSEN